MKKLSVLIFFLISTFSAVCAIAQDDWYMHITTYAGVHDSFNVAQIESIYFTLENESGSVDTMFQLGNSGLLYEMVWVEAGTFWMGALEGEDGADGDEYPRHEVTISQGFWIGKYEITQQQWEAVMGDWNFAFDGHPNRPAENLSWYDLVDTCIPLLNNAETGNPWRLPTEAEWEFACRAREYDESWYFWGNDPNQVGEYAWYSVNSNQETHDVGLKLPNQLGIYDMYGNVWEWCSDYYDSNYYTNSPSIDPPGAATGTHTVRRGGSWIYGAETCRSADRTNDGPQSQIATIGARLVRVP